MSGIAAKVVEVVLAEQCGYFFWQSGYKEGVICVGSFYFGDDIAGFIELAINTVSGILFEIEISVRQFVGSRSGIIATGCLLLSGDGSDSGAVFSNPAGVVLVCAVSSEAFPEVVPEVPPQAVSVTMRSAPISI